ncbi:PaaI family thioesterase [Variovorax paradoxus]|nr:PaaI family thioesterase [Variovorax paradoxus]MBT2304913.1 PaaI family thioesterase [Variovorax paradoxus]
MSLHLASAQREEGDRPSSGPQRYVPFSEHLGLRVERTDGGEAVVSVELRPELLNNHASGHGGVLMTLLDSAMAHAALSRIGYAREVVTVDMHIAFMRPTSGRLQAQGRATGGGRSVCFCEATVTDAGGEVAARAMGTFRYREPT